MNCSVQIVPLNSNQVCKCKLVIFTAISHCVAKLRLRTLFEKLKFSLKVLIGDFMNCSVQIVPLNSNQVCKCKLVIFTAISHCVAKLRLRTLFEKLKFSLKVLIGDFMNCSAQMVPLNSNQVC